jgi:molecular chaperone GrpE
MEDMTDKKHKKENETQPEDEVVEVPVEAVAEAGEQTSAEVDALKKQLEETEAKASEYKDKWIRSEAEFQNYRKRIERDHESTRISMKSEIVKKVLPVLDDLERALQNRPSDDLWAGGIELIVRKFQGVLESEGIRKIEAEGAEFDPNFHEAISNEPSEEVESGHVIAVVQNGYMLGERVIRPALVRVAQ